jgi:hypothetical protein
VEGCEVRDHLEIDHVDGWAVTRTTTLERLARLCRWHHGLKTYGGYRLEGRPGSWRLVPPEVAANDGGTDWPELAGPSQNALDLGPSAAEPGRAARPRGSRTGGAPVPRG